VCRQSDATVRRALRKYRVGSIIQLGIIGYVAVALPYWVKVRDTFCTNSRPTNPTQYIRTYILYTEHQAYVPYTENGLPIHVVKELKWSTLMGEIDDVSGLSGADAKGR